MWNKKTIIILGMLLFFSVNASAFGVFVDNFNDVNGTDLNVHNPDWNAFSDSTSWYAKIIDNNAAGFIGNDGVGGTSRLVLENNDANLLSSGDLFELNFIFKNYVHLGGPTHQADFRLVRPNDDNQLVNIRFETAGGAINNVLQVDGIDVLTRTASMNDWFTVKMKRKASNFVFDINFLVNGSVVSQTVDQNLNSNSIQFFLRYESAGPGVGNSQIIFDDFNITNAGTGSAFATYSNYATYSGDFYVRDLNYSIEYLCSTGLDANVQRAINDVNDSLYTGLNCNNSLHSFSDDYTHSVEGLFNIKFYISDSNNNTSLFSDVNFISDLINPTVDLNNSNTGTGFSATPGTVNLNLTCNDTISPVLDYNVLHDSNNVFSGTFNDGNTQVIPVAASFAGDNFIGICTDLVGNTASDVNSFDAFVNCFNLVDEQLGTPLTTIDVNEFGDLIATSYLTSDVFNFKSPLATSVCFTSTSSDTIRFDMNYSDGTQLFREFNQEILLNYDQNIPVCIAELQSFFEQDFTSARNTPVVLKQQISQCYNTADYTKYAEGDALSLRAFTVVGPYYMETFDTDGNKVVLSQINGGAPSGIQIDVLKFKLDQVPIQTVDDYLGVSLLLLGNATDSNTLKFFYLNYKEDNIRVNINITDDNGSVFDYNEVTSPNSFVFYFDHTLVPIDGNFLTVTLTKTKDDGTTDIETKIISLQGTIQAAQGVFGGEAAGIAAIFAIVIFLFGFTMVGAKYALGWVGVIVSIISLIVLTLASQAWYIIWLQAIILIIAIYLAIAYKDQHAAVS